MRLGAKGRRIDELLTFKEQRQLGVEPLMEKYREWKKNLHMVSIWDSLKVKCISQRYDEAIRDMYDRISINI